MRQILVTGANKGIGLAILSAILQQHDDTYVLLGARDPDRGQGAAQALIAQHPNWADRLEVFELDVASDASVTAAAQRLANRFRGDRKGDRESEFGGAPLLYAIVNNAGVVAEKDLATVLNVNVMGIQRVCSAFMPVLDPSRGRIVNITSAAGPSYVAQCDAKLQRFLVDPDITWSQLQAYMQASISHNDEANPYGLSKACANSYTLVLARENPHLRINACTPGFIETDATRGFADAKAMTPAQMGMKPPSEGTKSALHLLFADLQGNGRYYGSDAVRSPLDRYRAPGSAPYSGDS